MKILLLMAVGLAAGAGLWIRFAPSEPGRWHVVPPEREKSWPGGLAVVLAGDAARFRELVRIAENTPRTRLLAGDAGAGHVTFVTRSALWGFPDYTTIAQTGDQIRILARLRFGRSDLGVNRARVRAWIQALEAVEK